MKAEETKKATESLQLDLPSLYFLGDPQHANYIGPVTVSKVEGTKEKRGLITTRDVKQGKVMMGDVGCDVG